VDLGADGVRQRPGAGGRCGADRCCEGGDDENDGQRCRDDDVSADECERDGVLGLWNVVVGQLKLR
jgi:hypothetical protein